MSIPSLTAETLLGSLALRVGCLHVAADKGPVASRVFSFSLVGKSPGGWPGGSGQWESLGSTSLVATCGWGRPPWLLGRADLPSGQVAFQVGLAAFWESIAWRPTAWVSFPTGN